MFSNKGYGWKVAGIMALLATLGICAALRGESINPSLWRCVVEPEHWGGTPVWVPAARVVSAGPNAFVIETSGVRVEVRSPAAVAPGETVALTGTFRSAGPHLELKEVRRLPSRSNLRWLLEAVSLLVLAGVILNFARHFAFRPKAIQLEGAE